MLETRLRNTTSNVSLSTDSIITGFTAGSVIFIDSAQTFAQNNANFFWDDTNVRLGIGTSSPVSKLQLNSTSVDDVRFYINNSSSGSTTLDGLSLQLVGSAAYLINYEVGSLILATSGVDRITISSTGTVSIAGITSGSVLFSGASGAITQDNANFFWDDTNNRLGIGTSSPGYPLDVNATTQTRTINVANSTVAGGTCFYATNTGGGSPNAILYGSMSGVGFSSPTAIQIDMTNTTATTNTAFRADVTGGSNTTNRGLLLDIAGATNNYGILVNRGLSMFGGVTPAAATQVHITPQATGNVALLIRGIASQTANFFSIQDSSSNELITVSTTTGVLGGVVINEQGSDADFRVEGVTVANLLFLDASTNRVGIGTGTPSVRLTVGTAGTGTNDEYISIESGNGTGAQPVLRFTRNATVWSYIGIAGSAGGIVAGSALGDLVIRSESSNILFSNDAGTSIVVAMTTAKNVKIAGTATRATTEGTNHLDIFDGTAPVGTLANGISLYSTSGELRVMDAAGNATLLSPHDSNTNEWIFYSKNTVTGKVIRIDMERLMRAINEKLGGGFVHEYMEAVGI